MVVREVLVGLFFVAGFGPFTKQRTSYLDTMPDTCLFRLRSNRKGLSPA